MSTMPSPPQKLLGLAFVFIATVSAQNVPAFRSDVFLVHLDAEVVDQNKRPLAGLTKDDFRILDGGQEQAIVAFSEGEQPLDLILLFDISGSMRIQVKKVAKVAHEGLRELRPGDRVCVMVFSTKARVVAPFTEDLDQVGEAINSVVKLRPRGGTRILESVSQAADHLLEYGDRDNRRRRAVLVTTDNIGQPSFHKKSIIEKLWEADALLSGLVVPSWAANLSIMRLAGGMRVGGIEDLVEQTGGDIIRSNDLGASFPEMMHRIRSRYTLYYKLPDAKVGSLRQVDVQLSAQGAQRFPGARVVARHAYRLRERDQYGFSSR
jgi:VWFA-related protein